ncbi:MAG: FAD-dependent thymidylate synthase [Oscillospiraceae bacterium]|nr:FAD-dependent thymidylate synthase [Oscillospiraceae bacterium]MBR0392044.1 FAD-dependent thymidylate synthase [Oscillospiraceae bacterium]
MKVELIAYTPTASGVCCDAAAICTDSNNGYRSLQHSLASGHESVLEHAVFTFRVEGISRVTLAQFTRHRLASFSVQSQRYVKLEDPELIVPESIRSSAFAAEAESSMRYMLNLYKRMVEAGIPAEDARYVTPQAVPTSLIVTLNARELRHFFSLRCCNRAQWEIRKLADEMLKLCKKEAPILFENAGPGCIRGKCPEKRSCGNPRSTQEWE